MKIGLRRSCRLPGRVKSRLARTFDAEEISTPRHRRIKRLRQALHGQRQYRTPFPGGTINIDTPSHPALQIAPGPRADIEIDPHSIWRDFDFLIPPKL